MYAINDIFSGVVAIVVGVVSFLLYLNGMMWFPFSSDLGVVFYPMIITIIASRIYYSRKLKGQKSA